MAAKDIIHDAVRAALQNDRWTITHDPYTIEYEGKHVYADLAQNAFWRQNAKVSRS